MVAPTKLRHTSSEPVRISKSLIVKLAVSVGICAFPSAAILKRTAQVEFETRRTQTAESRPSGCNQSAADQAAIVREAEASGYTIRRLEFVGNKNIRDVVLRKRMSALQEGNRFARSNLVRSLASVSRLKTLHPVRLSDVVLRLDETEALLDMVICFREKNDEKK